MKISILTMFPQLFESFTQGPVIKRVILKGSLELEIVDIKDFAPGSFRHIDDSPFGGGAGMVMRCGPVLDALKYVKEKARSAEGENPKETLSAESAVPKESNDAESAGLKMRSVTAAMSPAGARFDQKRAHRYADLDHLILICGHYEGIDERIYRHTDEEISIGDYILTGGEIAAMAVTDAVTRLLPGAIRSESTSEESFENGLLEYPQYTQPAVYEGEAVPEILLSGNHEKIRLWRLAESLRRTLERRPDLIEGRALTEEEAGILRDLRTGRK